MVRYIARLPPPQRPRLTEIASCLPHPRFTGATRGSGTPAVLVCSSGTAVANMLPAVIEAAQTGVPLIVVSADRPAEMRDTGANQTIDQVKIFGGYTRCGRCVKLGNLRYSSLPCVGDAFESPPLPSVKSIAVLFSRTYWNHRLCHLSTSTK